MTPLLKKAFAYLQAGDADGALFFLDSLYAEAPKNPDVCNLYGLALVALERHADALPYFETALDQDPDFIPYYINFANALMGAGAPEKAVPIFKKALAINPRNGAVRNGLAHAYAMQGALEEATDLFLEIAASGRDDANLERMLATILKDQGRLDEAFSHAEKAVLLDNTPDNRNALGIVSLAQGNFEAAKDIFRALTLDTPNFADGWNNLGIVFKKEASYKEAEVAFRQALSLAPTDGAIMGGLAYTLARQNRMDEAEALYEKASLLLPEDVTLLNNKALFLQQKGDLAAAQSLLEKALTVSPDNPSVINNLGSVYRGLKLYDKAIALLERLLEKEEASAGLYNNIGLIYFDCNKWSEAEIYFKKALEKDQSLPEASNNYANLLMRRNKYDEAEAMYLQALEARADYPEALGGLGNLCLRQREYDKAKGYFEQVLEISPGHPLPLYSLGVLLWNQNDFSAAMPYFEELAAREETSPLYLNMLGVSAVSMCDCEKAFAAFRRMIDLPDNNIPSFHSNYIFALHYDEKMSDEDIFDAHLEWNRRYAAEEKDLSRPHKNLRNPDKKLKIAYLSGDFRAHSVAFFAAPLLEAHDRSQVEVYAYSNVQKPDKMTGEIKQTVDHWKDIVGLTTEELLAQVLEDEIDILIDLSGHTADNHMVLFTAKAAPVQASYLGYPNTTGLDAMDYRIVDDWTDPIGTDKWATETLVRLPESFLCYRPHRRDVPDVAPAPHLTKGHVTFGCFNNLSKVGPSVLSAWGAILAASPEAHLFLKAKQIGDDDIRARVEEGLLSAGARPDQLIFESYAPNLYEHLSLYGRVDLALDSFPYNGTTTTCEALWMGVPVLTYSGHRHSGRVSSSILTTVGMDAFVATDRDDYIAKAISFARDPASLASCRAGLREKMASSPLCDEQRFARHMEDAYREMWRTYCAADAQTYANKIKVEQEDASLDSFESEEKSEANSL